MSKRGCADRFFSIPSLSAQSFDSTDGATPEDSNLCFPFQKTAPHPWGLLFALFSQFSYGSQIGLNGKYKVFSPTQWGRHPIDIFDQHLENGIHMP
jgi:hypothetical protein